jgi:hypothetical protein
MDKSVCQVLRNRPFLIRLFQRAIARSIRRLMAASRRLAISISTNRRHRHAADDEQAGTRR